MGFCFYEGVLGSCPSCFYSCFSRSSIGGCVRLGSVSLLNLFLSCFSVINPGGKDVRLPPECCQPFAKRTELRVQVWQVIFNPERKRCTLSARVPRSPLRSVQNFVSRSKGHSCFYDGPDRVCISHCLATVSLLCVGCATHRPGPTAFDRQFSCTVSIFKERLLWIYASRLVLRTASSNR